MLDLNTLMSETAVSQSHFQLQTTTPLLMHGWKDDKGCQKAELRATSFKGMMRYWWRALQYEQPSQKLFECETSLFGGTEQTGKSPLAIYLDDIYECQNLVCVLPHRSDSKFKSASIPKGTDFTVSLSVQKRNQHMLSYYSQLFAFMLSISGFGQRSRRGFGSLRHLSADTDDSLPSAYLNVLHNLLKTLHVTLPINTDDHKLTIDAKKNNHPVLRAIYIGESASSAEQVVKKINQASHDVKNGDVLGGIRPRKPSPLHVSVQKIHGAYYPVTAEVHKGLQDKAFQTTRNAFLQKLGTPNT